MKTLLIILLVFITITHAEDRFFDTSYDCTKTTKGSVERSVCTDEQLAKLDRELSTIYSSFYYVTKEIKNDQRKWMKQRNQCKNTVCIQKTYESRIADLNASLNNEKTFPKTYLEAMKLAQMNDMLQIDPRKVTSTHYDEKRNKAFQEDFFHFRNITFKTPLIAEVKDYNDPKLKEILGECHGYRFDLYVVETAIRILELQPTENHYLSPDPKFNLIRNPVEDLNLYIWKLNAKGKEWLIIRPKLEDGYDYVIDPAYCSKLRYGGDVAQALNNDKQFIKHMFFPNRGETRIITYKNKEYGFGVTPSLDDKRAQLEGWGMDSDTARQESLKYKKVYFWVTDLLELQKHWKPIEFIGEPFAAITFEVINTK